MVLLHKHDSIQSYKVPGLHDRRLPTSYSQIQDLPVSLVFPGEAFNWSE